MLCRPNNAKQPYTRRKKNRMRASAVLHMVGLQVRAHVESQIALIAAGKADKSAVVDHTLQQFLSKFLFFSENIARMDVLFEANFAPLTASGVDPDHVPYHFFSCANLIHYQSSWYTSCCCPAEPIRCHFSVDLLVCVHCASRERERERERGTDREREERDKETDEEGRIELASSKLLASFRPTASLNAAMVSHLVPSASSCRQASNNKR